MKIIILKMTCICKLHGQSKGMYYIKLYDKGREYIEKIILN